MSSPSYVKCLQCEKSYVIDTLHMYEMNNLCLVSLLTELFEAYPIPLTQDVVLQGYKCLLRELAVGVVVMPSL